MVIVKLKSCRYNGRSNQNTSFFFSEIDFGFTKGELVTCDWVLNNFKTLKKDIKSRKYRSRGIEF